jgi:hypothetical protein
VSLIAPTAVKYVSALARSAAIQSEPSAGSSRTSVHAATISPELVVATITVHSERSGCAKSNS